jgi:CHASE2 domain-containing sensor protein
MPPTTSESSAHRAGTSLYERAARLLIKFWNCSFVRRAAFAALFAFIAFLASLTSTGEEFRYFTYRILQSRLTVPDDLPVAIIDISQLKQNRAGITPRDKLKQVVQVLVNTDREPAAIGIDIDFSPERDHASHLKFLDPKDPLWFSDILLLQRNIYLGIYRTRSLGANQWLMFEQFRPLAVAIWRSDDDQSASLSLSPDARVLSKQMEKPTLSAALAARLHPEGNWKDRAFSRPFLQPYSPDKISANIALSKYLIDYSVVDRLKRERVVISRSAWENQNLLREEIELRREDLAGKAVLLGDVSSPEDDDIFPNPATGKPVAGVLINGAAAYTLARRPLYVFTCGTRLLFDFVVALTGILLQTVMNKYAPAGVEMKDRRELAIMAVSVAVILALGLSINLTHILWDDFIFVAALTAIHGTCEKYYTSVIKKLSRWLGLTSCEVQ